MRRGKELSSIEMNKELLSAAARAHSGTRSALRCGAPGLGV